MSESTEPSSSNPAARAEEFLRAGREQEALAAASQALKCDPAQPAMWGLVGFLFLKRGRWKEAEQYLRQGLALAPQDGVMRSRFAMALMEQDSFEDALAETKVALAADPRCADAMLIEGEIFSRMGRYRDAISRYEAASDAGLADSALFALGAATFLTGNLPRGLALLSKAKPMKDAPSFPDWHGEEGPDLHVLLCGAYGFGDIIHFARYAHALKKRVGKVTFDVPEELVNLLCESFPVCEIVRRGDVLPAGINRRCLYMDLPVRLGAFDAKDELVPYLKADAARITFWEDKLKDVPHPRIALVWAGNPLHQNDRNRSVPFAELAPLIEIAKPHLISLQRDGRQQAKDAGIFDATLFIKDFADSAAFLKAADLLITIDSAPAHLGGALGIPTYTLLPFNPDWRWLLGREDSIWYPTMKLFRQEKAGEWTGVMEKLYQAIKKYHLKQ